MDEAKKESHIDSGLERAAEIPRVRRVAFLVAIMTIALELVNTCGQVIAWIR